MFTMKVDPPYRRLLRTTLLATAFMGTSSAAFAQPFDGPPPSDAFGQAAAQAPATGAQPATQPGKGVGAGRGIGARGGGLTGVGGYPGMAPGGGMHPGMPPGSELPPAAEMLGIALQANPDIQVARAKVAEAESELRRVQLNVARQVFRYRQEYENQKAKVARLQKLHANKATSAEELSDAVNELTAVEAELQYLLGRSPTVLGAPGMGQGMMPGMGGGGEGGMAGSGIGAGMGMMSGMGGSAMPGMSSGMGRSMPPGSSRRPAVAPEGATAEKLVKALQANVSLKLENVSLQDVVRHLQETAEVQFVIDTARLAQAGVPLDMAISVSTEGTALAAVLQLIEDLHPPITFVVRDYGVFVTDGENLPSGALSAQDFLKATAGPERNEPVAEYPAVE